MAALRPIDVDATLDRIGFGRFHWLTIPAIGLFVAAQSLQTNLLAFLPPCAGESFGISPQHAALLTSASFGASCVATPFFGSLADTHGRRLASLLAITIMAVAGICSSAAPTFGTLVLLQGLVGVGLGGSCCPFELLAELSPSGARGGALNAVAWFWSAGTLLTVLLAWLVLSASEQLPPKEPWRQLVLVANLPVLLAACILPLVTESPSWLLARGRRGSAKRVLWHMATVNRGGDASVSFSPRIGLLFSSAAMTPLRPGRTGGTPVAAAVLDHYRQPLLLPELSLPPALNPLYPAVGVSAEGSRSIGRALSRPASWMLGLSPLRSPLRGPRRNQCSGFLADATICGGGAEPPPTPEDDGSGSPATDGRSAADSLPTDAIPPLSLDPTALADSPDTLVPPTPLLRRLAELAWPPHATGGARWQSLTHWLLWLLAGFGWAGIVFTGALSTRTSREECRFDFEKQAVICAMEFPGTLLVQLVVDRPRGPGGIFGGRRGVQLLGFGAAVLYVYIYMYIYIYI